MSESILEEAQRLIHGDRNKNYGHPRDNFSDIAALFSGYLERPISDIDVANLMILVKVARVKDAGYHRDSFTDIAGYAGCVERIYEEEPEPVTETVHTRVIREWTNVNVIPQNVRFRDKDGDEHTITAQYGPWQWLQDYAPFTEIV
ncbi:hypothetical protein SEA_CHARM_55 [Mycobacterium phage Charm]|nr:hypothetical protein SEA_CHARM_55 [Mycobacterium phage Charm]QGJ88335.1 hypothetical protein SEA_DREAMTEAM1_55 [Mycobacterium phage DreamTeam1]